MFQAVIIFLLMERAQRLVVGPGAPERDIGLDHLKDFRRPLDLEYRFVRNQRHFPPIGLDYNTFMSMMLKPAKGGSWLEMDEIVIRLRFEFKKVVVADDGVPILHTS